MLASKCCCALAKSSWGELIGYMFRSTIICLRCSWALAPPLGEVEALMIAAGLPSHELSSSGLFPHSIAFFSRAEIE